MKKLFVLLLCILALFAIVSCKEEPEQEVKPAGSNATEADVLAGTAYYRLTATIMAKRFTLRYADDDIAPEQGNVLTLKYRTNHAVTHLYVRDEAGSSTNAFASKTLIDDYITGPDSDGWYTLTFTYPEMADEAAYPAEGIRLELANYLKPETGSHDEGIGKFIAGDYLDIRDLTFNGTKLTIEVADDGQSDHGIWNDGKEEGSSDQTNPTLEMRFLD